MNFERSEILNPILDDLAANDQTHFSRNIAPPILTRLASQGLGVSSMAVELIFQGFRDELTKRGDAILSEMDNVLRGAYVEDFDTLAKSLKAELIKRLESAVRLATAEFLSFNRVYTLTHQSSQYAFRNRAVGVCRETKTKVACES